MWVTVLNLFAALFLGVGIVEKRVNKSKYFGVPRDPRAVTNYRRGQALIEIGTVCFVIRIVLL